MINVQVYRDNYGVWMRASHRDVHRLGFADEIRSKESRMSLTWVYLYGDDGQRFLHRAQEQDQVEKKEMPPVEKSTIRQMAPFNRQFLMFVPLPGRRIRIGKRVWEIVRVARKGGNTIFFEEVKEAV